MEIQLIRSATMRISYAGKTILTDPMLSPKQVWPNAEGVGVDPTVELPFAIDEILNGVDSVLVSHIHGDHFDDAAKTILPKAKPLFCQPCDSSYMVDAGFEQVLPIETSYLWGNVTITRTGGQHGRGEILKNTGPVSGFVLESCGEPTVYWVGDSVWCEEVEEIIERFTPDIIIAHSGGAFPEENGGPIIMDEEETLLTAQASTKATVVAIHMEALSFCPARRKKLRKMASDAAMPSSRLMIPEDGETLSLS